MNQFRQSFLHDAARYLQELREALEILRLHHSNQTTRRRQIRCILQNLHTIKGSATIFELRSLGKLAHKLETVAEHLNQENQDHQPSRVILNELSRGFNAIEICLKDCSKFTAQSYLDAAPHESNLTNNISAREQNVLAADVLPVEYYSRLNSTERQSLANADARAANFNVFQISLALNEFHSGLIEFQTVLLEHGEIIANLPAAAQTNARLNLQIVFAGDLSEDKIAGIVKRFDAQVLFDSRISVKGHQSFAQICALAFLAGRYAAEILNKQVEFEIVGEDIRITQKQSQALSIVLLHLIRNAVAHGVEIESERIGRNKPLIGKIQITAQNTRELLLIKVADDGAGINKAKIRQTRLEARKDDARENEFELDAEQLQTMIFAPGFSTVETTTELAGRGIGLAAVETALQQINGSIKVVSEVNRGTTFEILLPV